MGGIGPVSSVIMCGTHLDGRLGARHGCNAMSPCGSTRGGDAGAESGIVSGVCTLAVGVTYGGNTLVKISASSLKTAV